MRIIKFIGLILVSIPLALFAFFIIFPIILSGDLSVYGVYLKFWVCSQFVIQFLKYIPGHGGTRAWIWAIIATTLLIGVFMFAADVFVAAHKGFISFDIWVGSPRGIMTIVSSLAIWISGAMIMSYTAKLLKLLQPSRLRRTTLSSARHRTV